MSSRKELATVICGIRLMPFLSFLKKVQEKLQIPVTYGDIKTYNNQIIKYKKTQ